MANFANAIEPKCIEIYPIKTFYFYFFASKEIKMFGQKTFLLLHDQGTLTERELTTIDLLIRIALCKKYIEV
jgi:hypothetical protein